MASAEWEVCGLHLNLNDQTQQIMRQTNVLSFPRTQYSCKIFLQKAFNLNLVPSIFIKIMKHIQIRVTVLRKLTGPESSKNVSVMKDEK